MTKREEQAAYEWVDGLAKGDLVAARQDLTMKSKRSDASVDLDKGTPMLILEVEMHPGDRIAFNGLAGGQVYTAAMAKQNFANAFDFIRRME